MSDRAFLEMRIAELVTEFETLHCCEVSSLWIEHLDAAPAKPRVTVTVSPQVKAA